VVSGGLCGDVFRLGLAKANCAVARKLVARTRATIASRAPDELRDPTGTPVTRRDATKLAAAPAVPHDIRRRTPAHSAPTHRARPTRQPSADKRRCTRAAFNTPPTTGDHQALDNR
jgi:hypothetical protein